MSEGALDGLLTVEGPHQGQEVLAVGVPPAQARGAVIMVHGRGGEASDILSLSGQLGSPGLLYLAPQAEGNSWYPNRFIAPLEANQPWLDSALGALGELLARLGAAGIGPERVALLGFSQGACLALEYAARNAQRYGAVVGFSGGLIGPPDAPRDYEGSLDGTPLFLGCSDIDGHIPLGRVEESAEVLGRLGAAVDKRIYPGMGHTINRDELAAARSLLAGLGA